jgi:hypothetical protein
VPTYIIKGEIIVNNLDFKNLDLGSSPPTSVPMEVVEVEISGDGIVQQYASAFVKEALRVAPERAKAVDLTSDEMVAYSLYLLSRLIEVINNDCKDFRRIKVLYVPTFLQFVLSTIGIVIDRQLGLKFVPVLEHASTLTYDEALSISEKIGSFEHDLQIVSDAMPREISGDENVMRTIVLAGYVRATRVIDHPVATYVSAFLNFTLRRESDFAVLYRVQYDDLAFIASALTTRKELYQ